MEHHDGKPVTRQEGCFRRKPFEVAEAHTQWLVEDMVTPWLVLGVSRESTYKIRKDDPESKLRVTLIDVDTAVPVVGELRPKAIEYLAKADPDSSFASAENSDLDRLEDYLRARWAPMIFNHESTVDAAIGLLERFEQQPEPRTGAEQYLADRLADEDHAQAYREAEVEIDSVEVVGSIHSNGKTRALLDKEFGNG